MVRVYIVFYSRTGNTATLARAIAEGVARVPDTEVWMRRVRELAPQEVVAEDPRWKATQQELASFPEADIQELREVDALIMGTPTRYGNMSAQLKNFVDQTGPLWVEGVLVNKVGSVFTSNSTAHSGLESTLLTMMVPLLHLGFIIVGVSPAVPETMTAGSYYGAGSISGPGAGNPPTAADLVVARAQGERVARIAAWLKEGRARQGG